MKFLANVNLNATVNAPPKKKKKCNESELCAISRCSFGAMAKRLRGALVRRSPRDANTVSDDQLHAATTRLIQLSYRIPGPRGVVRKTRKPSGRRGRARSDALSQVLQKPQQQTSIAEAFEGF